MWKKIGLRSRAEADVMQWFSEYQERRGHLTNIIFFVLENVPASIR